MSGQRLTRVRLKPWRFGLVAGAFLFFAFLVLASGHAPASLSPAGEKKPVPVRTARVTNETVVETARFAGSMLAWRQVDITPSSSGNVVAILADQGATVAEDAPLFQLFDLVAKAERDSAKSELDMADKRLWRSRKSADKGTISKLALDKANSDFAMAQAKLDEAQAKLDVLTLRAPFAGKLGLISISNGAFVQPGQTLVELSDDSRLYVDFRVPQRYLSRLSLGQTFTISSDAFPDKTLNGIVNFLDPSIDEKTRSIDIRGLVSNADGLLTGGLAVSVELDLGRIDNATVVPVAALIPTINGNDVFRVVSDKVQRVAVKVGIRYRDMVVIQKGLAFGDQVVTLGQFNLEDGTAIQIEADAPELAAGDKPG